MTHSLRRLKSILSFGRSGGKQARSAQSNEFILIAENGVLEQQALLLCESIRRYVGDSQKNTISVVSPRAGRRPSEMTIRRFRDLDCQFIPLDLSSPCPEYGCSFRVFAASYCESRSSADVLIALDSDLVFLAPWQPELGSVDALARPVDHKGICSSGPGDPNDQYWQDLCRVCEIDYEQLPFVTATVEKTRIKASYNNGFIVARREIGVFQRTEEFFLKSQSAGLKPIPFLRSQTLVAGYGQVSAEGMLHWGTVQSCLSLAVWGSGVRLGELPPGLNFPLHCYEQLLPDIQAGRIPEIILPHYHYLFFPVGKYSNPILDGSPGFPSEGSEWLRGRLADPRYSLDC